MTEVSQGPGFHPLYLQVKELLIQRVLAGYWKPGELLPSEMKLAAEYQVSQGTVRKALEEMAAEHLVVRHQGKGTFVSARDTETSIHFFSVVTRDNRQVSPGSALLFEWKEGPATKRERAELRVKEGEQVYRIHRVRPVNGRPALVETLSVAKSRFLGLPELMRSAARMNAYLIMEKEFGILVVRAEEWVDAIRATPEDANLLGIEEGAPMLRVTRIAYALDGSPVECRRIRFTTDKLRYYNTVG